ncbi:hypothetical protein INT47_001365, partial [Mucor saturninus]
MPPKRKQPASLTTSTLVPRHIKIAKKKMATAQSKYEAEECRKWFDKYADKDNRDLIGPDGCQSFFSDIGISLESIQPLIIGYKMKSSRMGYITWDEWFDVIKPNICSMVNDGKLKVVVDQWEGSVLNDPEEYMQFYLFTFNYAKTTGQKSMDVETAIAFWQIMLQDKYPIVKSFIQFLQEAHPVKVINKDQWSNMLYFCQSVPEDLRNYDNTSSWPVLFDDYVEWRQS